MAKFSLTSTAFADEGTIPRRHTCDGEDRSPPLSWSAPPAGTRWLALIIDDPDAPGDGSSTGLPGVSPRTPVGLARGRQHRRRDATTSARSATAAHARPTGGTAPLPLPAPRCNRGPRARTRRRRPGARAGRGSQGPRGCGARRHLSAPTWQLAGEPTTNLIAPARLTILGEDDPGVGQRRDLLGDSSNRRAA
jgi:Phosphatidylethanolamine-binding protein